MGDGWGLTTSIDVRSQTSTLVSHDRNEKIHLNGCSRHFQKDLEVESASSLNDLDVGYLKLFRFPFEYL